MNSLYLRVVSLTTFLSLCMGIMAQVSIPTDTSIEVSEAEVENEFFCDGKEWELCHFFFHPTWTKGRFIKDRTLFVKVVGEDEVEGRICKRLEIIQDRKQDCGWCELWPVPSKIFTYEEDGKLFVYRTDGFSSPVWNDTGYGPDFNAPKSFQEIADLNDESKDGNNFWYIPFMHEDPSKKVEWIEEVGFNFGFGKLELYKFPIATGGGLPYYMLVKCTQNGHTLYDASDELNYYLDFTSGNPEVETEDETPIYFNLHGVRVAEPSKGEILICNGKKRR